MSEKVKLPLDTRLPVVEITADDAVIELQLAVKELQKTIKNLFEQMRRSGIAF